ncbi:polymorphic toxin type 44 domain-containing protein [Magnetococcus sp. PR-3]|uniref:polymorphic toxin type 44 domain-containing protein n=1 Tax=Magnetococcus sp. PR-3 TaxID=3120355 RepID=UPI002FCE4E97
MRRGNQRSLLSQQETKETPRKLVPNSYLDIARQMREGTFTTKDTTKSSSQQPNCNTIANPIGRESCRKRGAVQPRQNEMQQARQMQKQRQARYDQTPDLSKPPVYGWEDIDRNMETTQRDGWFSWVNRVREGGDWDYKVREKPDGTSWGERERAANINYGATCVVAGHNPETCMKAGGAFQALSDLKNLRRPFKDSSGRPWDDNFNSCMGEPTDDCRQVEEGIRYGLEHLRRNRGR